MRSSGGSFTSPGQGLGGIEFIKGPGSGWKGGAMTQSDSFRVSGFPAAGPATLSPEGARLMQSIPISVRPLITAKRHAHIINRMALLWQDPKALRAYFDELMVSSRPGRRGFAIEVLDELLGLQNALQERQRI
ncbi:hypothetical protein C7444_10348 [Sphaerotilus hippei]|uniref:Uncharacterized protein n=2 Tax=Sphaerotilus hippei TaxID=744406 RepID=A0A318H349_9BURK|nr:hypothetical protein C7444_10348 [Sphaerotilus hippei]